jgi:hypothetical protein
VVSVLVVENFFLIRGVEDGEDFCVDAVWDVLDGFISSMLFGVVSWSKSNHALFAIEDSSRARTSIAHFNFVFGGAAKVVDTQFCSSLVNPGNVPKLLLRITNFDWLFTFSLRLGE